MVFQRMPFGRAIATDKYYRYLVQDRPEMFWMMHKRAQLQVDSVSESCRSLILAMLQQTPELRPSTHEIMGSEWMTKTPVVPHEKIVEEFTNRRAQTELIR